MTTSDDTRSPAPRSKAPGAKCEECPLKGRWFVPTEGPASAKIVVVGEAPGYHEATKGRPFVGPSGVLLNGLLQANGIRREDIALTNVVACHPKDNETPNAKAIACCSERLQRDIEGRNPDTIFALGSTASKAVMQNGTGILSARVGPPKESPRFPDARVIPTIHPAYALRSPNQFPFLQTDFQKLYARDIRWTEPAYDIPETEEQAHGFLAALQSDVDRGVLDKAVIDIETGVDKDVQFEHPSKYELLCLGIAYRRDKVLVINRSLLANSRIREDIRRLLSSIKLIAQNGKFDLPGLRPIGEFRLWFDTLLAHYATDERGGIHSLDFMAREILQAPDWKATQKEKLKEFGGWTEWCEGDPDSFHLYNVFDCAATYQLYEIFAVQLEATGLRDLHDFLVRASQALMQVEWDGVRVDIDYLQALAEKYQEILDAREERLSEWVGNPRSPAQIGRALAARGVKTSSTDVQHLQEILAGVVALRRRALPEAVRRRTETIERFVTELLGYRKDHKVYGTYIAGTEKRLYNGRVYTNYLLHGTVTGRLSSRNPNLQNIPRGSELRSLYVPNPGNVFLEADYSGGEFRVVASISGCRWLIDRFRNGIDPLYEIASRFYGPDRAAEYRVRAKVITYGSLYAGSSDFLASEAGVPRDEVASFQRFLWQTCPEIKLWHKAVKRKILNGEDIVTPFGRHRRFAYEIIQLGGKGVKDAWKEALADVPQGTLSDLCLDSLQHLVSEQYQVRITVHDSIITEAPREEAKTVANYVSRIMQETAQRTIKDIPMPAEVKMGESWGACKT